MLWTAPPLLGRLHYVLCSAFPPDLPAPGGRLGWERPSSDFFHFFPTNFSPPQAEILEDFWCLLRPKHIPECTLEVSFGCKTVSEPPNFRPPAAGGDYS